MAWTQAPVNYFKTLGLRETADEDRVVKRAYREKALQHHSDRGGDNDEMVRVNAAYEVLRTRAGRATHRGELMRIRRHADGTAYRARQRSNTANSASQRPTANPRQSQPPPHAARPSRPSASRRDRSQWVVAVVWGLGTGIATGLKALFFSTVAMCFISAFAFDIPVTVMSAVGFTIAGVAAIGGFLLRLHMVLWGEPPAE